eukprot:TRINITY_DN49842_c0_g1_i1.p4 TRINITY_DN49842_c0_g1~~TRINITY_DN49842_c0_g1_i1.p4  ORF type:complete len:112 (+),score=18.69 TRINITY_DN49842_c0_g1_i1:254-589(+)
MAAGAVSAENAVEEASVHMVDNVVSARNAEAGVSASTEEQEASVRSVEVGAYAHTDDDEVGVPNAEALSCVNMAVVDTIARIVVEPGSALMAVRGVNVVTVAVGASAPMAD